jgi:hypothetical protein
MVLPTGSCDSAFLDQESRTFERDVLSGGDEVLAVSSEWVHSRSRVVPTTVHFLNVSHRVAEAIVDPGYLARASPAHRGCFSRATLSSPRRPG